MWLIVGLGNPGKEYEHNRHNVGFMAVDVLHDEHNFSGWQKKFKGLTATGTIAGEKALLLKPQTFMNLSGESVLPAASFYKIPTEKIIVIYDELDLDPFKTRIRQGGGTGGHNGLKSINAHLNPNYWRVRIGIGHPGRKELVSSYVLHDFAKDDQNFLDPLLKTLSEHFDQLLSGDANGLMNKLALSLPERT